MTPTPPDMTAAFLDDFFAECEEYLTTIRRDLVTLEQAVDKPKLDPRLLEGLLRAFHTIKGLSGMVGLQPSEKLAHHIESYLRLLRKDRQVLTAAAVGAVISGTRTLEDVLATHRGHQPLPDIGAALSRLEAVTPKEAELAPAKPAEVVATADASISLKSDDADRLAEAVRGGAKAWKIDFSPSAANAERGTTVNTVRARLESLGEIISGIPRVNAGGQITFQFLLAARLDAPVAEQLRDEGLVATPYQLTSQESTSRGPTSQNPILSPANIVRVDLSRLDEVMRLLGQLVVSRSRLGMMTAKLEAELSKESSRELREVDELLERQIRDLRESVMSVRMVPIGETFARMQFVVRDLIQGSGKQVRLEMSGQETEIDKYLVEHLMEPLLHLVRNAVGHGLETSDVRIAQGKPAEGLLALRASTSGDHVILTLEDDGAGIDVPSVIARARPQGLPVPSGEPDAAAVLAILCAPGFSTRDEADRVAGRGVGMSVVRSTVEDLGGQLTLFSEKGKGTRFTLRLPLTLTIVEALIARVGKHSFAFPLGTVEEAIEVPAEEISVFESNEIMKYRGAVLPLVRLSSFTNDTARRPGLLYALIVTVDASPIGIVVDRVVGQREIVVHAFKDSLVKMPGVSGATQLGDGQVILILDGPAVARYLKEETVKRSVSCPSH